MGSETETGGAERKRKLGFGLLCVSIFQLERESWVWSSLSGPVPRFPAKTFNIVGNPLICGSEKDCYGTKLMPMSMPLNSSETGSPIERPKSHKVALALGLALGFICLLILGFGLLLQWRQRQNQQIFFDVKDRHHEEVSLGNLRRFQFRELQVATDNFSSKNILGKGGSRQQEMWQRSEGMCRGPAGGQGEAAARR
ncbi:unnamed protein product [Camellia sinensis]